MALACDRNGVPQYSGEVGQFEEYKERALDLFYGRSGQNSLQAATPLHLRAGCTGAAYDSVRGLPHAALVTRDPKGEPTDQGIQLLLNTLEKDLAKEKPVRASEQFEKVFYDRQVWRRSGESMAE